MSEAPRPGARDPAPYLAPDGPAIALARRIASEARHGALATLDATDGLPLATRVALAREAGGDVLMLLSDLSDHTRALRARAFASILLGSVEKGDPLTQPRLTLRGEVSRIAPDAPDHAAARARYLARHPRARLYVDFADFGFYRLRIDGALLNGGFARAYRLARADLTRGVPGNLVAGEASLVAQLNEDHADRLASILRRERGIEADGWRIVTLDPQGFEAQTVEAQKGDALVRVDFAKPVETVDGYRDALLALARDPG